MTDHRHNLKPEELAALEKSPQFFSTLTCEYRDHMGDDDAILQAMLVSTQDQEMAEDLEKYKRSRQPRLDFMMAHKHGSPFEQASIKLYVKAPIMVFREWHRHRIGFSYNEASARYKVMPPEFYIAPPERPLIQEGKHSNPTWVPADHATYVAYLADQQAVAQFAWDRYVHQVRDLGIAKESARAVLGVGLYSDMITTLNPRSCMAFLSLRQHHPDAAFVSHPQWEINQCANHMEQIFKELFPLTHMLFVQNGRVAP